MAHVFTTIRSLQRRLAFWQQQVEAAAKIGTAAQEAALIQVRHYQREIAKRTKGRRRNGQK